MAKRKVDLGVRTYRLLTFLVTVPPPQFAAFAHLRACFRAYPPPTLATLSRTARERAPVSYASDLVHINDGGAFDLLVVDLAISAQTLAPALRNAAPWISIR
jgi:hypothetical protein